MNSAKQLRLALLILLGFTASTKILQGRTVELSQTPELKHESSLDWEAQHESNGPESSVTGTMNRLSPGNAFLALGIMCATAGWVLLASKRTKWVEKATVWAKEG